MPTRRQHRINELLLEEISLLVPGQVGDEDLSDITVTRVESTQDQTAAKVYVTLGQDATAAEVADALSRLKEAQGLLMDELSTLGMRRVPRLSFAHDRAHESGQRVLDILSHLEYQLPVDEPAEAPAAGAGVATSMLPESGKPATPADRPPIGDGRP
jgi:ribosome-binding factor A